MHFPFDFSHEKCIFQLNIALKTFYTLFEAEKTFKKKKNKRQNSVNNICCIVND